MADEIEFELDPDDLIKAVKKNIKKGLGDFEDIINLDSAFDREIIIGDIDYGSGLTVDGMIRFWNKYDDAHNIPIEEREPIKLIIDSCGGSLSDAFTIIDSINCSKTPIHGICIGTAYSAGFFIFISCHKRFAYPHASFLFHEGSAGNSGTAAQFANFAAFYKKQLMQLEQIVIKCTNITEKDYQEIKKDDVWFDVVDGIEKGFIEEVIK